MNKLIFTLLSLAGLALLAWFGFGLLAGPGSHDATEIGAVSTNFRLFGPNDKVVVERVDDPKVANVSCFISFAQTGGVSGGVGVAENPSQFALQCVARGPVTVPPGLPAEEEMSSIQASFLFKHFILTRMYDAQSNTLVYVLISTRILSGSPANAVSAVPVAAGG
ncbi:CreA family protein [Acidocella sp.]|uniref:CreA family protein n=1 Tax=Acidocella sp. TaxID=50710 RepID=UPI0026238969|nr:CreA family protein [Acidocella sp.]